MKLYKIASAPPGERWHSAKTGLTDFVEVELEKQGRLGMAAFLNTNEREIVAYKLATPLGGDPTEVGGEATAEQIARRPEMYLDPLEAAELRAVAAAKGSTAQLTATSIVAFILDDATVAQAEAVFAALGTRFKEQADAAR